MLEGIKSGSIGELNKGEYMMSKFEDKVTILMEFLTWIVKYSNQLRM